MTGYLTPQERRRQQAAERRAVYRQPTDLPIQRSACHLCVQGPMDADCFDGTGRLVSAGNDHLYGRCPCACHQRTKET